MTLFFEGEQHTPAGEDGTGGGGERASRQEAGLAAAGGEEDETPEGGRLAGGHLWPGGGEEGQVLGPIVTRTSDN